MKVHSSLISALAMAAAVSTASAQDFATSIGANAKAVLFSFSGLSALGAGTYNGGVGAKYYMSNLMALRGGLGFGYSTQKIPLQAGQVGNDGANSFLRYGANAGVELHLVPGRVSPFVGGAVNVSSLHTQSKNPVPSGGVEDTDKNGGRAAQGGLTVGAGGLLGVEFFLTKEISLSAEYALGYNLTSPYDYEQIRGAVTTKFKTGATNSVAVTNSGALTLAVYF